MSERGRILAGLCLVVAAAVALPQAADAQHHDNGGSEILDTLTKKGASLGVLDQEQTRTVVEQAAAHAGRAPKYKIGVSSVCGRAPGAAGFDNSCGRADSMCQSGDPARGLGPPIAIWLLRVNASGEPLPKARWVKMGDTCFPELVPGAPALTMAMIRDAFHDTDFSRPRVHIQPEGDVTLVNLPTYFEVEFPEKGFGPGEVDRPDPGGLLGYVVEVRPRLKSVTYHLGEKTVGPTQDLGGPYPTGKIVHTYRTPGDRQVRVDVVYTGQFRVGGSGWIDIPGEVELRGQPVTLSVRQAKARLYTN